MHTRKLLEDKLLRYIIRYYKISILYFILANFQVKILIKSTNFIIFTLSNFRFKMYLVTDDGYLYTRKLQKYKFSENVFHRPCSTVCCEIEVPSSSIFESVSLIKHFISSCYRESFEAALYVNELKFQDSCVTKIESDKNY